MPLKNRLCAATTAALVCIVPGGAATAANEAPQGGGAGQLVAFYVDDIDAAVAHMVAQGVEKLFGPLPVTEGAAAGQTINYFRAPFGTYIELISYPRGMAYERDPGRPLWSPKRNGRDSVATSVPSLLGMDHAGITVPDIDVARQWFVDVL